MPKEISKRKPYILIADDDAFLVEMYVTKFKASGFEVDAVQDGAEVLKSIKAKRPDILLLDVMMPNMTGFEVMQEIQKTPALKDLPVVMLTNLGQKDEVERGLKLGARAYVIKVHFTPTEVVDKVKEVLKSKK